MKRMLFTNGTYNDIPLIESAHKLGLYVITSGNNPEGEAHKYGDEYCCCDFTDKEAMLELAKEKHIDFVCSCGNDLTAITAAYIAEKVGLPGHDSYAVSRVFHEKDGFKKIVNKLKLTSPNSALFTNEEAAISYIREARFPQIVKPVDLGGGKGISVAHSSEEGIAAVKIAFEKSKNKHIVIEDYIEGTQHGFVCYIKDKKVIFDYSTNDYSYLNPFMVWIGSGYPADKYESVKDQIISDVEKMACELGMADGFLTIQYMMHNGKAYYLETMRRCLGNFHFKCISRDIGINLYDLFIRTECGMDCSDLLNQVHETGLKSGFLGIYADKNGIFESVEFDKAFENHIYDRMMLCEKSYKIDNYLEDKLGMVWFSFNNEKERKQFIDNRNKVFLVNLS